MAEINAWWVSCTKHAHGGFGSRDYSCHQEVDTTAFPHVFASTKHFHAENFRGRSIPTSSPNMPGILLGSRSSSGIRTYGMYQIPPSSFLHTSNLSDRLLSRKEIDGSAFIEELGKLIICQCCAWQQILSIMPPFKTSQVGGAKSLIDIQ
jgi:hypothetical protein